MTLIEMILISAAIIIHAFSISDLRNRVEVLESENRALRAAVTRLGDEADKLRARVAKIETEPERVKGEWYFDRNAGAVRCSVCGEMPTWYQMTLEEADTQMLFCPTCGADMRG